MKNLQQCTKCLMVLSKDDTTCPNCGEDINLDLPEEASGCYEPESSVEKFDNADIAEIFITAIWFVFGFLVGLIF